MGKGKDTKPRHRRTKAEIQADLNKIAQERMPAPIERVPIVETPAQIQQYKVGVKVSDTLQNQIADTTQNTIGYKHRPVSKFFETLGIKVTQDAQKTVTGTIPDVNAAFAAFEYAVKNSKDLGEANTRIMDNELGTSSYDEFSQATTQKVYDAAQGIFDKTPFIKAREVLANKIGSLECLTALQAKKRKRTVSEHDGELDFDRLYERQPFYNTVTDRSGVQNVVDLIVNFSFNCGVSNSQIEEYGAVCWSVADLLERSGIQCNIIIKSTSKFIAKTDVYHGETIVETGAKHAERRDEQLLVKSADQYQDALDLARCFTPWFLRRVIFTNRVLIADAMGIGVTGGLGTPIKMPMNASLGRIELGAEIIKYSEVQIDQLKEFIKTAVTKG